jgi:hypothetical protein
VASVALIELDVELTVCEFTALETPDTKWVVVSTVVGIIIIVAKIMDAVCEFTALETLDIK